mgnify:FL=1
MLITIAVIVYALIAGVFILGLCKAAARGDAMSQEAMDNITSQSGTPAE